MDIHVGYKVCIILASSESLLGAVVIPLKSRRDEDSLSTRSQAKARICLVIQCTENFNSTKFDTIFYISLKYLLLILITLKLLEFYILIQLNPFSY